MTRNYGPARYVVTWHNGEAALILGKPCSAVVLDTALEFAKKASAIYKDSVLVREQAEVESVLRAFGVLGAVRWAVECTNCGGKGKVWTFAAYDNCLTCSGLGKVPES